MAQVSCGVDDSLACLVVRVAVLNDNGGSATPYDFRLHVDTEDGNNFTVRGDPEGTPVPLNNGSYDVSGDSMQGYTIRAFTDDCEGIIENGERKTCTVIYDDDAPPMTITVQTDKENYNLGDVVRISGTITGINPSGQMQTVELHIFTTDLPSPSFNIYESADVSSDGSFIHDFRLDDTKPTGYYRVIASYDDDDDNTQDGLLSTKTIFNVAPPLVPSSVITVQSDKPSYNTDDMITISGRVTEGIVPDSLVYVKVLDPNGYEFFSESLSVDQQSGSYSSQPKDLISAFKGEYLVRAEYNNANAESHFTVVEGQDVGPQSPLDITVEVSNSNPPWGNPVTAGGTLVGDVPCLTTMIDWGDGTGDRNSIRCNKSTGNGAGGGTWTTTVMHSYSKSGTYIVTATFESCIDNPCEARISKTTSIDVQKHRTALDLNPIDEIAMRDGPFTLSGKLTDYDINSGASPSGISSKTIKFRGTGIDIGDIEVGPVSTGDDGVYLIQGNSPRSSAPTDSSNLWIQAYFEGDADDYYYPSESARISYGICTQCGDDGLPSEITANANNESPRWESDSVIVSGSITNPARDGTDKVSVSWGDGTNTVESEVPVSSSGLWGPISHKYDAASIDTNPNQIIATLIRDGNTISRSDSIAINVQPHKTSLELYHIDNVVAGQAISVSGQLKDKDAFGVGVKSLSIAFTGSGASLLPITSTDDQGLFSSSGPSEQNISNGWAVKTHFAGNKLYSASDSDVATYNTVEKETPDDIIKKFMNNVENSARRAIVPLSNTIAKGQGSLQTGSSISSSSPPILFIALLAAVALIAAVAVPIILHNIQKHGPRTKKIPNNAIIRITTHGGVDRRR